MQGRGLPQILDDRDQSLWHVRELGEWLPDTGTEGPGRQAGRAEPCLEALCCLPIPGLQKGQAGGQGRSWPGLWSLPQGRQPRGRPVAAQCWLRGASTLWLGWLWPPTGTKVHTCSEVPLAPCPARP